MKFFKISILSIIFSSCIGVETSNFGCRTQFIVNRIEAVDSNLCVYVAKSSTYPFAEYFANKPAFVAKKGLFQIGDTVRVCK